MRLRKIAFGFLLSIVLATNIKAQESAPLFDLYAPTAVVSHGRPSTEWDGRYTDPGAVFYHDGQFHMFRNGFQAWPASVQIGYLTSPDGFLWTEVSEDPILFSADVPFTDLAALASSALVTDDGRWLLYFYTWHDSTPPAGEIGVAIADNPLGPWSVHPAPVLTPGSDGAWDSLRVDAPSVLKTADGYLMYYAGFNRTANESHIGMARSRDGLVWEKYDDPATTDPLYAESDPVLFTNEDGYRYHQPRVERVDQGYLMVFRIAPMTGNRMGLRLATSANGIDWELIPGLPFWDRDTIPGARGFWFTATAYHDDTLYLYIEGGRGANTDIYAAAAHVPDLPW